MTPSSSKPLGSTCRVEEAMAGNEAFQTQALRAVKNHLLADDCEDKKCCLHNENKKGWEKHWKRKNDMDDCSCDACC